MKDSVISIHNLSVAYHRELVLNNVSLEIPKGSLMAVVGPNGAGKSTLIQSMLGFLKPISGIVKMNGEQIHHHCKNIGYVPQRSSVDWDFPTSVFDTVLMGTYHRLGWFRRPGREEKKTAVDCIEKVGMAKYSNRHISELSGGQQQRVFLARALAQEVEVYLMDEPLQGIDSATEKTIVRILKTLQEKGKTIVVVHHDLQSLPDYFDHVTLLNRTIIAHGPLKTVLTQKNLTKTYGGYI